MIRAIIEDTYPKFGSLATTEALRAQGVEMNRKQVVDMARYMGLTHSRQVTCTICGTSFATRHPMTRTCSASSCRREKSRRQHLVRLERRRLGLAGAAPRRHVDESDEDPRVVAALKARDLGDANLLEMILAE